jgi:Mg2+-importing ATPase
MEICQFSIFVSQGLGLIKHRMKYLKLILAANFGNMISVVAASAWFPFDPISPTQMVLQNLLYDLGQIAIPFDNVDHEHLAIPRRLSIGDLTRFVLLIGPSKQKLFLDILP